MFIIGDKGYFLDRVIEVKEKDLNFLLQPKKFELAFRRITDPQSLNLTTTRLLTSAEVRACYCQCSERHGIMVVDCHSHTEIGRLHEGRWRQ